MLDQSSLVTRQGDSPYKYTRIVVKRAFFGILRPMQALNRPRVVVIGGGFAGIETIKTLQALGAPVDITLISKDSIFQYYPALYKLVTGALPIETSVPLRKIFPHHSVSIYHGLFTGVDQARQVVLVETTEGTKTEHPYDYLVIALGSETNFFNIKGLPELSHSFKSIHAALKLKKHFCSIFLLQNQISWHAVRQVYCAIHLLKEGMIPLFFSILVNKFISDNNAQKSWKRLLQIKSFYAV